MASHVSDTERAIFWTKWRFQQCYRNAGNSENLGIIYKNTTVKKKLIILATISVVILFFLKTRLLRKPNESKLTLETLEEDNSFDDKPEIDFKNKINVNEQQDRIKAEMFEANDFVGGFADEKLSNDIDENNGFGEDAAQDSKIRNGAPIVPVLQPPRHFKDDGDDSFDIKLNDQVPMPEIKGTNDTKTVKEKNPESNWDQKKKIEDINAVDQDLKAGDKKKKKKKPLKVGKLEKGKKNDKKKKEKGSVISNIFPSLANNDTIIQNDLNSDIEKKGVKIDSKVLNKNENIETTEEIKQSLASIASYMNGTEKEAELIEGNIEDNKTETKADPTSNKEVVEDDNASESQDEHINTKKKKKKDKKTKLKSNKDSEEKVESKQKTIEEFYYSETEANPKSNKEVIVDDNASESQDKHINTKRKKKKVKKTKLKSNKDSETEEELESKQKTIEEVDYLETKDRIRKKNMKRKNKKIKGKKKALKTKTNLSHKNAEAEETYTNSEE